MTGLEYEHLVAKYLRRHGYHGVSVTKGSGDYGVDVIAHKYGHKYAVQCKYYVSPVSLDAVQEVIAGMAMYGCDRAMVVTNSTYTESAKTLANANKVVLLSGIEINSKPLKKYSLFSLIKLKISGCMADKQINRVIKPGKPKKFFTVKGEVDRDQKYKQTCNHYGELHSSTITGLPHKFTVLGKNYDIDKIEDVRVFPLNFSSFHINGTKYFFNDYFRLCAKFYRDEGCFELADALEAKAVEIEKEPLFGLYVKENSKTIIQPPKRENKKDIKRGSKKSICWIENFNWYQMFKK